MFSYAYTAVVMIFGIVLTSVCYVVRRLESRPVRLASVITALAVLVGALVPVVRILTEPSPSSSAVVAPAVSGTVPATASSAAQGTNGITSGSNPASGS